MSKTKSNKSTKRKNHKKRQQHKRKNIIILGAVIVGLIVITVCVVLFFKYANRRPVVNYDGNVSINVLLTNGDSKTWENVTVSNNKGMTWTENGVNHNAAGGEEITFSNRREIGTVIELNSSELGGEFSIESKNGGPYPGIIKLYYTDDGLKVTNLVPLEEYIKGVIVSEMPKRYGLEALKAQAVCARSYVLYRNDAYAYEDAEADVDDTISYQVYAKTWASGDAIRAVDETAGMVVMTEDKTIANTMFYSTSCGYSQTQHAVDYPYLARKYVSLSDVDPLKKAGVSDADKVIDTDKNFEVSFANYIKSPDDNALEKGMDYFRWEAVIDNPSVSLADSQYGKYKGMTVLSRSTGGVITGLRMEFEKGYDIIDDESSIRRELGKAAKSVKLSNGSNKDITSLPSSAFTFELSDGKLHIYGGGFGHGCGLSQNAAKELADEGKNYVEILQFFYKGCSVNKI